MKNEHAREHSRKIAKLLRAEYRDASCALVHRCPLQLLVATMLSAQCTDERVNMVTPGLFSKYPNAAALADADLADLESAIKSTGFFRNKAKNIRACCRKLVDLHGGEVPRDLDALVALPGVGRKTANVVLGTAFGIAAGVVVDTHVTRLSRRMGLTRHSQPEKIERDLMDLIPKNEWVEFSHRMIRHGRRVCNARKPDCDACVLAKICPRAGVAPASPKKSREKRVRP